MGYGIQVRCEKCDYSEDFYLGAGGAFPLGYQDLIEQISKGEYGAEWKKFFAENPGAAVNAEKEMYRCPKCNHLESDHNLSLYLNMDGTPPENGYWAPWYNDGNQYRFIKSYIHKCPDCTARMHKLDRLKDADIQCPECGRKLIVLDDIMWD